MNESAPRHMPVAPALRRLWSFVPLGGSLPEEVWDKRHRFLSGLTWFHAAIIALVGPVVGYSWELSLEALLYDGHVLHTVGEGLIVAFFAALAGWRRAGRTLRATTVGFGLMSSSAILVHLSGGYIELHFHFFVMLVFLALYQDWAPYLLSIVYVAIHHGVVGVLWPEEVYNHTAALNAPWTWAGIHAFFVLWSCVGSVIAWRFNEKAFAQTKLILDSAGEGICGVDREGKITFINQAATRMLSLDARDVVGRPVDQILNHATGNESRFPAGLSPILAPLNDGTAHQAADEIFWRQDGTSFPVDYVSTPIIERGELTGLVVNFKDVTERTRTEAARRAAEARFTGILDIAADGIISVDENQRVVLFNKGAEQIFGYSAREILGQPLDLLLPPRLAEAHRQHIQAFAAGSQTAKRMGARSEVLGQRRDGTEFPAEASISKLTQDGKTICTVILRDISERKQAEKQAQHHLERIRTLQEIDRAITSTLDLRTVLELIADSAVQLMGAQQCAVFELDQRDQRLYTRASRGMRLDLPLMSPMLGQGASGVAALKRQPFFSPDVYNDPLPMFNEIAEEHGKTLRDVFRHHGLRAVLSVPLVSKETAFGALTIFWKAVHSYDEREVHLLSALAQQAAVAIENARLFEETQHHLERIRALREIDQAITSTLDLRTVLDVLLEKIDLVLPYSAVTVRLFNKESGLLEPVACRNLDEKEWKAEEWKGGRGTPNVAFESKAPVMVRDVQTDPRLRDPEFFRRHGLVSYLGVPLIVQDEVLGVISFYTKEEHEFSNEEVDFLSTLAGQAAIAIHNSEVYEEMAKLAADLSRSNKVKDEFLSVMSHELRTPLNVVMGYTGMIKDGLLGEINPEQEKALEKVITRARDQLTMISGILQATQLEAEGVKVEPHEVNLEEFLNDLKLNYALASGKELNIVWDYPPDLPAINTDAEKLKQVLQNLINNAIKFTEKGGVTISARLIESSRQQAAEIGQEPKGNTQEEDDLTLASRLRPHAFVEFRVTDTGIGIAEEHLPIIFERFRQIDSSETRLHGGIGMGLYIVKKFTELLGGVVDVESELGKGSTFTVTIPMTIPQQAGTKEAKGLILPT